MAFKARILGGHKTLTIFASPTKTLHSEERHPFRTSNLTPHNSEQGLGDFKVQKLQFVGQRGPRGARRVFLFFTILFNRYKEVKSEFANCLCVNMNWPLDTQISGTTEKMFFFSVSGKGDVANYLSENDPTTGEKNQG